MKSEYRLRMTSLWLAVVALAACGGGGGGGSSGGTPKNWGTAVLLESDAASAFQPQIAFDPQGNALAVWLQADDVHGNNVWSNRYTAGVGWGTAVQIESAGIDSSDTPRIVMDAHGNGLAVWSKREVTRDIWANRYTVSVGWGTAVRIETDDAGGAVNPQIAIDANGSALAVWSQDDGTRNNIVANRYDAVTGWGSATLIESDDTGGASTPRIAFAANGDAIAVWVQSDGTRGNVVSNRYNAGTGWGTATLIETDAGDVYDPQIAVDQNGNAISIWSQFDGANTNIVVNRYTTAAGWGTAAPLTDTINAFGPQIAIDHQGNAVAIWVQQNGAGYDIWADHYKGGNWGATTLMAHNGSTPQVVFDANGNAFAVWSQSDGTRDNAWVNRYTGGGWGTAALIETNDAGGVVEPQIAVDAKGNALAVWYQSNGVTYSVWANRYQ